MGIAAQTVTLVVALAAGACASKPIPLPILPGQDFMLRIGEAAQTQEATLRIGFEAVKSDSRCPKNVQCFWAGEAVVQIWLQQGAGPKQSRELHLPSGATQAVRLQGQDLRLVALRPEPIAGRSVADGDYVATFRLATAAETERQSERANALELGVMPQTRDARASYFPLRTNTDASNS